MKRNNSITDVPGIKVGHWTDRRAATGCTVVLCEKGAVGGVDVRGAAPGTRETDLLRPGTLVQEVHAVLLSGGSAFGIDAASGVMRWCEEQGIGLRFGGARVPIVPAAILFDLGIGRSDVRPGPEAGYAAASAAKAGRIAEGSVGAGTGATVARVAGPSSSVKSGIGMASEEVQDGLLIGAIVAVNAGGEIVDSSTGSVLAGPRRPEGGFQDTLAVIRAGRSQLRPGENTTVGVVATNARLSKEQTNRLATVAHDGYARAIRPAHTMTDGDVIFALATGDRDLPDARTVRVLEAFAPVVVERAVVRAVLAARSLVGVPSVSDLRAVG
jgi:L-aminopeptidase/D-esterase-like protein